MEMAPPTTNDWIRIENEFRELWNFPNCIGVLDGKHVVITSPAKSGSLFFNYKSTFWFISWPWWMQTTGLFLWTLANTDQMLMVQFFKSLNLANCTWKTNWMFLDQNICQEPDIWELCPMLLWLTKPFLCVQWSWGPFLKEGTRTGCQDLTKYLIIVSVEPAALLRMHLVSLHNDSGSTTEECSTVWTLL